MATHSIPAGPSPPDAVPAPSSGDTTILNRKGASAHPRRRDAIAPDPIMDVLRQVTTAEEKVEAAADQAPELIIGDQRYKILRCLGGGGLGSAYLAQREDGERVALKVTEVDARASEPRIVGRLNGIEREGNVLQTLGELHCQARQIVDQKRYQLLVRTYHPGESLWISVREHPAGLPPRRACEIVLSLARQLKKHAEEDGLLHHDIKAANVILEGEGADPKLIDWNAATFVQDSPDAPHLLTHVTPAAAAPEQLGESEGSMASQVYCLGLLLLRLLGGKDRDPYAAAGIVAGEGEDPTAVILRTLRAPHPQGVEEGGGLYGALNRPPPDGGDPYLRRVTDWNDGSNAGNDLHVAIRRILHMNPLKRMTIDDLIEVLEKIVKKLERRAGH